MRESIWPSTQTAAVAWIAGDADAGLRLDEYLARRLNSVSKMRIARLIAEGGCILDGVPGQAGMKLRPGQKVEVLPFDFVPSSVTPQRIPLEVAFEDEHVIAVVKPSGMLVHPTKGAKIGTLANALSYYLNRSYFDRHHELVYNRSHKESRFEPLSDTYQSGNIFVTDGVDVSGASELAANNRLESKDDVPLVRPGIVHRLDRATSGLLVVAKTPQALSVLSRHFRKGIVRKKYLAFVHGEVDGDRGFMDAPIGRDQDRKPHWWVMDSGREAKTFWRVVQRFDGFTLLELEPITGRTNQLRIHCAFAGHPILGDDLYDNETGEPSRIISGRLFLHAWRLAFHRPKVGGWLQLMSTLPEELTAVLADAGASAELNDALERIGAEDLAVGKERLLIAEE